MDNLYRKNPMPEDEQIQLIGLTASEGKKVGVVVDSYKAARYQSKLTARFPSLKITCAGRLLDNCVVLTVEPKEDRPKDSA